MSDNHTPEQRHRNMAAVHSTSTEPELNLRRTLWRQGFRYRVNDKRLPGKPDIVLPKYRTVGHKECKYYTVPETNKEFWVAKVQRNQERDQEVWRKLEAKGWCVIIVWECQLKKANLEETIDRVAEEIVRNGDIYRATQEERKTAREGYRKARRERKERERALLEEMSAISLKSPKTPITRQKVGKN